MIIHLFFITLLVAAILAWRGKRHAAFWICAIDLFIALVLFTINITTPTIEIVL